PTPGGWSPRCRGLRRPRAEGSGTTWSAAPGKRGLATVQYAQPAPGRTCSLASCSFPVSLGLPQALNKRDIATQLGQGGRKRNRASSQTAAYGQEKPHSQTGIQNDQHTQSPIAIIRRPEVQSQQQTEHQHCQRGEQQCAKHHAEDSDQARLLLTRFQSKQLQPSTDSPYQGRTKLTDSLPKRHDLSLLCDILPLHATTRA